MKTEMNRRKIQNKNLTFNFSKYIRFEKKEGRQRQTFGHVLKKVIKGSASKHRENRVKLKVNKILKQSTTHYSELRYERTKNNESLLRSTYIHPVKRVKLPNVHIRKNSMGQRRLG